MGVRQIGGNRNAVRRTALRERRGCRRAHGARAERNGVSHPRTFGGLPRPPERGRDRDRATIPADPIRASRRAHPSSPYREHRAARRDALGRGLAVKRRGRGYRRVPFAREKQRGDRRRSSLRPCAERSSLDHSCRAIRHSPPQTCRGNRCAPSWSDHRAQERSARVVRHRADHDAAGVRRHGLPSRSCRARASSATLRDASPSCAVSIRTRLGRYDLVLRESERAAEESTSSPTHRRTAHGSVCRDGRSCATPRWCNRAPRSRRGKRSAFRASRVRSNSLMDGCVFAWDL